MSIRNAVCEKWNTEIIWANTNSLADNGLQSRATPRGLDPTNIANTGLRGNLAPPLKIAETFYTANGVPVTEDKTWDYAGRFDLALAGDADRHYLKKGATTVKLHFGRESRYYADLGFDGSIWYGQGHYNDEGTDLLYIASKWGEPSSTIDVTSGVAYYSSTGFWPKKLVHFQNTIGTGNTYNTVNYPWPIIRLADLYLLYAEAANEVSGPGPDVYQYVDSVRARAKLRPVFDSWTNYSRNPGKVMSKAGMREIIHRERLIELAFEAHRFWDLRRWKESVTELNKPITGWNLKQSAAADYYQEQLIFNQTFSSKDYLWPLNTNALIVNNKLVQNPGW